MLFTHVIFGSYWKQPFTQSHFYNKAPQVFPFEKVQINLAFCSLIRIFAPRYCQEHKTLSKRNE